MDPAASDNELNVLNGALTRLSTIVNHLQPSMNTTTSPSILCSTSTRSIEAPHLCENEVKAINLFETAKRSVVYVRTIRLQIQAKSYGPFGLLDPNSVVQTEGAGTGIVWDKDCHVVTNSHVVHHVGDIIIILADGRECKGTLVGQDRKSDIAVLKIELLLGQEDDLPAKASPSSHSSPLGVPPLEIGKSGNLQVGQTVYAIGNPFGLHHTMTSGIVSGLDRDIPSQEGQNSILSNLIQTDAPINPGNSGGPLLDSQGKCVGVTTAILSPTGTSSGLGFAVPIDEVKDIVCQLIASGRVVRPHLGVSMAPDSLRSWLKYDRGVVVWGVRKKSPAAVAGLVDAKRGRRGEVLVGDVIEKFGGKVIVGCRELLKEIGKRKVGDEVEVEVLRGAKRKRVTLVVKLFEFEPQD